MNLNDYRRVQKSFWIHRFGLRLANRRPDNQLAATVTSSKDKFASADREFANERALSLAKRELQAMLTNPRFWLALAAVSGVLAISGPFGTDEAVSLPRRLLYWPVIAFATYFAGLAISLILAVTLSHAGLPRLLAFLAGGAVAGFPVALVVTLLNRFLFEFGEHLVPSLTFVGQCAAISIAVSLLYFLWNDRDRAQGLSGEPAARSVPDETANPFFQRLSPSVGTDLVSLQARDHYVEATTANGRDLVLMRLGDAIEQLSGEREVPGMRVHRSWWVANAHAERLRRTNGRAFIVLSNGTEVPVSRGYLAAVRKQLEEAAG